MGERRVGNDDNDVALHLYRTSDWSVTATIPLQQVSANVLAYAPDGRLLAIGANDGRVFLWDVAADRIAATLTPPGGPLVNAQFGDGVHGLAFSRDGRLLAATLDLATLPSQEADEGVNIWDVATLHVIPAFTSPARIRSLGQVAFSPANDLLAVNIDHAIWFWTTTTWQLIGQLLAQVDGEQLSFSSDGHFIAGVTATAGSGGANLVQLWSPAPVPDAAQDS